MYICVDESSLSSLLPLPSLKTKETRKDFILDLFVAKNLENTIYCQRKIISHYIKRWENISFLCTMAGQKSIFFVCLSEFTLSNFVVLNQFLILYQIRIFDFILNLVWRSFSIKNLESIYVQCILNSKVLYLISESFDICQYLIIHRSFDSKVNNVYFLSK